MALGTVIKKRMSAVGIGNKELAEKAGIPLRTLNNILYGVTDNPTVTAITGIARALGCTIDELVEDMENPEHLTSSEKEVLDLFRQLNEEGQSKVLAYASDILRTGLYIKNDQLGILAKDA